jgi:hypothetical protein
MPKIRLEKGLIHRFLKEIIKKLVVLVLLRRKNSYKSNIP